jgi:hypothetical protein
VPERRHSIGDTVRRKLSCQQARGGEQGKMASGLELRKSDAAHVQRPLFEPKCGRTDSDLRKAGALRVFLARRPKPLLPSMGGRKVQDGASRNPWIDCTTGSCVSTPHPTNWLSIYLSTLRPPFDAKGWTKSQALSMHRNRTSVNERGSQMDPPIPHVWRRTIFIFGYPFVQPQTHVSINDCA